MAPYDSTATKWVPLIEFAMNRGVSLSTLRRYIKTNRIAHKMISGKYFVLDDGDIAVRPYHRHEGQAPYASSAESNDEPSKLKKLEKELKKAREEIAELKTLVALYEENFPT